MKRTSSTVLLSNTSVSGNPTLANVEETQRLTETPQKAIASKHAECLETNATHSSGTMTLLATLTPNKNLDPTLAQILLSTSRRLVKNPNDAQFLGQETYKNLTELSLLEKDIK